MFIVGGLDKKTGELSVMNEPKLRNATAIDKALAMPSVGAEPNTNDKAVSHAQNDKPAQDVTARVDLTADSVGKLIQGLSVNSCGEIDSLIGDLRHLREKLAADGGRIKQSVMEFTAFSQSVIKLTEVISDSVAHVRTGGLAR